jgi:hypothetical protein
VSCVTPNDCSFCTPTSFFNSGTAKCVCKFDYNVTIEDARQNANSENSNITINIRNFDFTGDFENRNSNEVDCRDILSIQSNDHGSYSNAFFGPVSCFVSDSSKDGEDQNGNDFTESVSTIKITDISSALIGPYLNKKFSLVINAD